MNSTTRISTRSAELPAIEPEVVKVARPKTWKETSVVARSQGLGAVLLTSKDTLIHCCN